MSCRQSGTSPARRRGCRIGRCSNSAGKERMMQQPDILNELRRMSARVGKNILLVQGAGGNSSVKDGDVLWVKASGTWLADAENEDIFVPVALSAARAALARGDERVPLAPNANTTLRGSIETALHALMPHPVVLHVH